MAQPPPTFFRSKRTGGTWRNSIAKNRVARFDASGWEVAVVISEVSGPAFFSIYVFSIGRSVSPVNPPCAGFGPHSGME